MNLQYDIISRAAQIVQVLFRLLLEMNHEVRGEARQESVDQVRSLETCPSLGKFRFSLGLPD